MIWQSLLARSRGGGRAALALSAAAVALGSAAAGAEAPAAVGILGLIAAAGGDGGVDRLAAAIERIEDGQYDVEVGGDRDDDVGRLATALESMAAAVRERERALRERCERLRAERDRLSALLERTPDPVVRVELVDEEVVVREVSERFEAAFGVDPATAVGESLFERAGPDPDSAIAAELRRSVARGEAIRHRFECETPDGRRTFVWRYAPAGDDEGYVVYTDVSEWADTAREARDRERALAEYTEYVDEILDSIDDAFYVLDRTGEHDRWNDAFREVTGYDDDEIEAMHPTEFFAEGDADAIAAAIEEAFDTGHARLEADLVTKDGERIPYELAASRLEAPDGTPVVAGIGRDVSERRHHERRVEALVENSPNPIYIKDREGYYRLVNDAAADAFGVEPEEMEGRHTADFHDAESTAEILEADRRVIERGEPVTEESTATVDGEERTFLDNKYPYRDESGEVVGVMGISQDVTERRRHERELERQASLLDALFEQVPVSIYVKDEEGRYVRSSIPYVDEEYAGDEEAFVGKTDLELFPEELAEQTYADDMRVVESGESIDGKLEYNPEPGDWVRTWKSPWRGEDGEIRGLIGVSLDVTEQRERKHELERKERRYQAVFEDPNILVGLLEPDGTVMDVNRTAMEYVDADRESVTGVPFWETPWWDEDSRADVREWVDRAADGEYVEFEADLVAPDGQEYTVNGYFRPVTDDDGEVVSVIVSDRDVTERRRHERELERQASLLDALFEQVPVSIYVKDEEGRYVRSSIPYLRDDMPDDEAAVRGKTDRDLFPAVADETYADDLRVIETGESIDGKLEYNPEEDDWVRTWKSPWRGEDGEIRGLIGASLFVTEQKERERKLRRLHETGRDLIEADDPEEVARIASEAAEGILGLPMNSVHLYDPDAEGLVPAATSDPVWDVLDELPTLDEGLAWSAYEASEPRIHGDVREAGEIYNPETAFRSEMHLPLGEHGVFIASATEVDAFDETDATLAKVLAATVQSALDRAERKQALERYREYTDDILDAVDDMFYVVGQDLQFQRWNDTLPEATGYTDAEIAEKHPMEFFADDHEGRILSSIEEVFETGHARMEVDLLTKAGQRIPYEFVASRLEDPDGQTVLVGVGRDVSERVEHERKLEALVENTTNPIYIKDREGVYQFANEATGDIFGLDSETVVGKRDEQLFDDAESVADAREDDRRVIETGETISEEVVRVVDGEEYVFLDNKYPFRDQSGEIVGVMGISRDITERVERERELAARSAAMEGAIDGMAVLDEDGEYVFVNQAHAEIYGYDDPDAMLGETWRTCYGDDQTEYVEEAVLSELHEEGSWRGEAVGTRADGTTFPQDLSLTRLEDGRLICIVRDITERKQQQRELEETWDRLQRFIEGSPVGVFSLDPDGRVLRWNDAMEEIFGWSADEVLGEPYPAVPDDRAGEHADLFERSLAGESISQVELQRERKDGSLVDVSLSTAPIYDDEGEVAEIASFFLDITERKERERELERTKNLLQQAQRVAQVGGWEVDLQSEPPAVNWTDELYRIHDMPEDADVDDLDPADLFHPDDRQRVREANRRLRETAESYDAELRLDAEGERWVRTIGEPVYDDDGDLVKLRGSVQDITDRKEHERTLETLHEVARELLGAESEAEVADLAVEAAREVLSMPAIAVYLLDPETAGLEPAAFTGEFVDRHGTPSVTGGDSDSLLWTAFATRTPTVFDDAATDGGPFGDVDGGLAIPVGDHGVLTLVAPSSTAIDARTRRVVETLVATTEAALDRLDSEASLRERESELEARNRRLEQQIGINEIIRSVDQALIRAGSRDEIETAVCERLVESEDVAFAWIGSLDAAGDRLEPRSWAGTNQEYLDAVSLSVGASEPAARTARTGEPTVVDAVVEDLKSEEWRKQALVSNFSSVISVPLAFDEYTYGVLTVYGTEPELFGGVERSVFEELGENVASSINAVETQRALHADTFVELTLRFEDSEDFLARAARASGCDLEYVGLATYAEDRAQLFFEVADGDPADLEAALSDLVSVEDYRSIGGDDGGHLFEATVAGDALAAKLVRHGASPRSMAATATGLEVVVDVPTTTDVREFVEMLEGEYAEVELVSRQDVERDVATRQEHVGSLLEELTDRQLDVLRTAYFAGFFEWPRESTGQDIADLLDVSQPTVNRHLRHGMARLLEGLFEEEAPPAAVAE